MKRAHIPQNFQELRIRGMAQLLTNISHAIIRMDLVEVGCYDMDWIGLARDRDR
jgi:hypothetical protein